MCEQLQRKISRFPKRPGIYLMKDRGGEVIYVGKAADLRARVRSYFQKSRDEHRLITRNIGKVCDIDIVVARSEKEAFILENNFIKQLHPKYNLLFRDDKSFVSIKVPVCEPYPRPIVTRRVDDEKARYFGPYSNSRAARETLNMLHELFPLRKCPLRQFRAASRPCLYGQMDRCLAPCCREGLEVRYGELVKEVLLFLEGRRNELLDALQTRMRAAAEKLDFERAAAFRDRIRAVEETLSRQVAGSAGDSKDRDVFGFFPTSADLWTAVLFIRCGGVSDAASYCFPAGLDSPAAMMESFIARFYSGCRYIPDEILVPADAGGLKLLSEWLSEKKGRKVDVVRPQRGRKKRLIEMACRNAMHAREVKVSERERRRLEMESLKASLGLRNLPEHIECFDISSLGGRQAAGSVVVFIHGEPHRASYRRYRIRDIEGQDDFAMMRQVIARRYRHSAGAPDAADAQKMPELVLVDGGKVQLEAARRAFEDLEIPMPETVALAKARREGGVRVSEERVFRPGHDDAVALEEDSCGFRLITRVRDEAHRFALAYHRKLRRKTAMESPLVEIPGIGKRMAGRLLDHFKSLERIEKAGPDELCRVSGISKRRADIICDYIDKNWR